MCLPSSSALGAAVGRPPWWMEPSVPRQYGPRDEGASNFLGEREKISSQGLQAVELCGGLGHYVDLSLVSK